MSTMTVVQVVHQDRDGRIVREDARDEEDASRMVEFWAIMGIPAQITHG